MCIHWCCKHCSALLTHRWAYERCNEYFVARSLDQNLIACPNGPWLLRRACHRHPYRGDQTCDECKKARRKNKKLMQSARQKANKEMGHRPDYNGAVYLGELAIPETIHRDWQLPLEPGRLAAMKAKWENFTMTHRHLPSHELEREWTKRFRASNNADLKTKTSPLVSKNAPVLGQRTSLKHGDQVDSANAGEASRNPQYIYRQSIPRVCEVNGGRASISARCNYNSESKQVNNTLESLTSTKQLITYKQNNISTPFIDNRSFASIEGSSAPQVTTTSSFTSYCTVPQNEQSQGADRDGVQRNYTSTPLSSSSRPRRTRPWDL